VFNAPIPKSEASNPHAAFISAPLDLLTDAEIPALTRWCLKYIILSSGDEMLLSPGTG